MKKRFLLALVLCMVLSLAACTRPAETTTAPSAVEPTTQPTTAPTTAPTEPTEPTTAAPLFTQMQVKDAVQTLILYNQICFPAAQGINLGTGIFCEDYAGLDPEEVWLFLCLYGANTYFAEYCSLDAESGALVMEVPVQAAQAQSQQLLGEDYDFSGTGAYDAANNSLRWSSENPDLASGSNYRYVGYETADEATVKVTLEYYLLDPIYGNETGIDHTAVLTLRFLNKDVWAIEGFAIND